MRCKMRNARGANADFQDGEECRSHRRRQACPLLPARPVERRLLFHVILSPFNSYPFFEWSRSARAHLLICPPLVSQAPLQKGTGYRRKTWHTVLGFWRPFLDRCRVGGQRHISFFLVPTQNAGNASFSRARRSNWARGVYALRYFYIISPQP